jgi:hypothetical protein
MFRSAALASAATLALAAYNPASATAVADVQTLWAVYLTGTSDADGVFTLGTPGISATATGDASFNGDWWGNVLTVKQSVENSSQSFDASAVGSLEITNSDPANIGRSLNIRQDASNGWVMLLNVDYPGLESASAIGSVTVPYYESVLQCGTGNDPGACDCTPYSCEEADFAESDYAVPITGIGSILTIDYLSTIHVSLVGDPPVPEPSFPWGWPLLLGTLMLPYARLGRKLR